MKLTQILTNIICNTILDPKALDRARRQKDAFTHNYGKLPYWTLSILYWAISKNNLCYPR